MSELELESIGVYNNGSSHSSYIDKDTNWEVSMYSRGASPPKDSKVCDMEKWTGFRGCNSGSTVARENGQVLRIPHKICNNLVHSSFF